MNNNFLLFGNGVSINFKEDFSLKYFFDLLKDKDKVKKLYNSFKKNLEDELKIIIDKELNEVNSIEYFFQFKRDGESNSEVINIILSYNINVFRYFQKHNQDIFEIVQKKGFENSLTEFIKGFVSNQNFKKLVPFIDFDYSRKTQNINNIIIDFLLNITTQFITNILCFYLLSLEEKNKRKYNRTT